MSYVGYGYSIAMVLFSDLPIQSITQSLRLLDVYHDVYFRSPDELSVQLDMCRLEKCV